MSLDMIKHYPVMLNEVLSFISDNKTIVDCTFGGGGYSSNILKNFKKSNVIGLDRDKNIHEYTILSFLKYISLSISITQIFLYLIWAYLIFNSKI